MARPISPYAIALLQIGFGFGFVIFEEHGAQAGNGQKETNGDEHRHRPADGPSPAYAGEAQGADENIDEYHAQYKVGKG